MIKAVKDKVVALLMIREKTASGLIIPDGVQEPQAFCKVISVGGEVKTIKEGDVVVSHMRGGMDVLIDRQIIKVLKEDEIYGLLTDESTLSTLKTMEVTGKTEGQNIVKPVSRIIQ